MSLHRTLVAKYSGKPGLLIVAAACFTFSLFGFYRYGYKPWNRKRKFNEAEEYANFVYEKEKQRNI